MSANPPEHGSPAGRQSSSDQEPDHKQKPTMDREGSMNKPEERNATDAPPEERVETPIGQDTQRRAAPIDQDVASELNAALPDKHSDEERGKPNG
jgi:hypothetical protein